MSDYARGEVLRSLRRGKGLSRENAAHEIGVTPKTLYEWENRSGAIKRANAVKLAEFYGVALQEVVTHDLDEANGLPSREQLDRIEDKLDRQYLILGDILGALTAPEMQREAALELISRAGRELAELGRQRAAARSGNSTAQRESRDRPATG